MQPGMDLAVTVGTDEDALAQFLPNCFPGSGVSFFSDPEVLVPFKVVESQRIKASSIPTKDTSTPLLQDCKLFQAFSPSGDVKLGLALATAEGPLASAQVVGTSMPGATLRNSRLLYH